MRILSNDGQAVGPVAEGWTYSDIINNPFLGQGDSGTGGLNVTMSQGVSATFLGSRSLKIQDTLGSCSGFVTSYGLQRGQQVGEIALAYKALDVEISAPTISRYSVVRKQDLPARSSAIAADRSGVWVSIGWDSLLANSLVGEWPPPPPSNVADRGIARYDLYGNLLYTFNLDPSVGIDAIVAMASIGKWQANSRLYVLQQNRVSVYQYTSATTPPSFLMSYNATSGGTLSNAKDITITGDSTSATIYVANGSLTQPIVRYSYAGAYMASYGSGFFQTPPVGIASMEDSSFNSRVYTLERYSSSTGLAQSRVICMTPTGTPVYVFGRAPGIDPPPTRDDPGVFYSATSIAVSPGNIFISDGGNGNKSRILHFGENGTGVGPAGAPIIEVPSIYPPKLTFSDTVIFNSGNLYYLSRNLDNNNAYYNKYFTLTPKISDVIESYVSRTDAAIKLAFPDSANFIGEGSRIDGVKAWKGSAWAGLRDFCAANRISMSANSDTLSFEFISNGLTAEYIDIRKAENLRVDYTYQSSTERIDVVNQKLSSYAYNVTTLYSAINDGNKLFSTGVNQVQTVRVGDGKLFPSFLRKYFKSWIAGVVVGPGYPVIYGVTDANGVNVAQSTFVDYGGNVTTEISDEPGNVEVTIQGPSVVIPGTTAPYYFGDSLQVQTGIGPSAKANFRIIGAGVTTDPETISIFTGIDPKLANSENQNVNSDFVNSAGQAYTVGAWLSSRSGAMNQTVSFRMPAESWPFGSLSGKRFRMGGASYIVIGANYSGGYVSVKAERYTDAREVDDIYASSPASYWDGIWGSRPSLEQALAPLSPKY